MTIDLTKPLELFNPTTGEVVDATFNHKECGGSVVNVRPNRDGWSCYNVSDGSPSIASNVWRLRNKVDVNLDLTKPLYVDGVRVYLIAQSGRDTVEFWQRMWDRTDYDAYINVSKFPAARDQTDNSTFTRKTLKHQVASCKIQGTISNNKGINNMLDLNKPLVVNGKDAKVVHTFPSGKLAVVVEGYGEIQHFDADGTRPFGGMALVNKVVETFRFVNVYPGGNTRGGSTHTHDDLSAALDGIGQQRKTAGAVMVKQTLIEGKVVKSELVD